MKRIAFFLPGLYGGGAERVFLNLAQGFTERGYQVDFVLAQLEGALSDQIPDRVSMICLNKKIHHANRSIRSVPALIGYLKDRKPDILITALHGNLLAIWAKLIARSPVKLIITEHNTFSIQNRLLAKPIGLLNSMLVHEYYPKANYIVAVSNGVADDLAEAVRLPRENIHVIVNPVITQSVQQKKSLPISHPWFVQGSPPVILAVGRLTDQKDFSTLIRAFSVIDHTSDCRLMILGDGELREELEVLIDQLNLTNRVKLPGFVENPYAYMANSALFVLSSKWEGLPTVLIEAMACGLPVISTQCPSGPLEILQAGRFGRLIPVGNAEEMASAIQDGLNGKIPVAPEESWQAYTLESAVDQYLCLLEHDS